MRKKKNVASKMTAKNLKERRSITSKHSLHLCLLELLSKMPHLRPNLLGKELELKFDVFIMMFFSLLD